MNARRKKVNMAMGKKKQPTNMSNDQEDKNNKFCSTLDANKELDDVWKVDSHAIKHMTTNR